NERIEVPATRHSPAHGKAGRSVDCAFGSANCGANSFGGKNLLFSLHRARIGLRAVWVHNPLGFRLLAPHKTRADLCLDFVSGMVDSYLRHSVSLRFRVRSSSPHTGGIDWARTTSN